MIGQEMPRTRQIIVPLNEGLSQLEALPQPVVAHGRELAQGETLPFHRHRRAQLVYASSGVMTVTTRSAAYVVPPQRAVWMPGGIDHCIEARNTVAMRTLYVEPEAAAELPTEVCVLQVTRLLRELIVTAVAAGPNYEPNSPQSRIMSVILDQIRTQPVASLALPMPTDPRLLRRCRGRENQHEEVVQKMPHVEEKKSHLAALHGRSPRVACSVIFLEDGVAYSS